MFIIPLLLIASASGDVGFSDTRNYTPVLKTEVSDGLRFVRFSIKDDEQHLVWFDVKSERRFRTKELARLIRNAGLDLVKETEMLNMLDRGFMSSQESRAFVSDLAEILARYPFEQDPFEREEMVQVKDLPEFRVEGYWSNEYDQSTQGYPFPKSHADTWSQKTAFLAKLNEVETTLKNAECMMFYRGLAPSRLENDVYVGSCEYIDPNAKIVWPCGYSQHYVDKHNVVPSADFYDYIMDLDVSQIVSWRIGRIKAFFPFRQSTEAG